MSDDMSPVEIYVAENALAAEDLRQRLEEEGIRARVVGDQLHSAVGALPMGVSTAPAVWVARQDAERAREVALQWEAGH